ncbi:MAG: calcium-binding protein, partial [Verrucomicrobiaceae bacterium]
MDPATPIKRSAGYALSAYLWTGACVASLTMGVQAATAPLSILRSGDSQVEISWPTIYGLNYQLQTNNDLSATWIDFDDPIIGTGTTVSVPASTLGTPKRFFRLKPPVADTITAVYSPATDILIVNGGSLANTIVITRDAAGVLRINNGGVPITGGTATTANTVRIDILGGGGNDEIALHENPGALPPARIFGEGGNDTIIGGSGADFIDGGIGNDRLYGRSGADNLTGGDGADTLIGGGEDDQISGGNQDDQIIFNPGDDNDLIEGDAGTDTITIIGQNTPESYLVSVPASRVRFERDSVFPFALDIGTAEHLVLNANGGDDTFSTTGNLAALIRITVYGGAGNDTLSGSNGPDILDGGDDIDQIDGQQGIDTIFGGNGDDVIQWDPGDGSDFIEGQGGQDTLLFNGNASSEIITVSPNGGRVTLSRNIGAILLDLNDVETLYLNLLGGNDQL